jgi:nitrate/nitrite transporter NarK
MTSEAIQRYIRIALFGIFGALGNYGFSVSESTQTLVIAVVGFLGTTAWSIWGHKLSNLLSEAQKDAGVSQLVVKVDPVKIDTAALAAATPPNVVVKQEY